MQHATIEHLLKTGAASLVSVDGSPVYVMKAQPTPSDVHVNTTLTNVSLAFFQRADAFVADRVFPNVPVSKQSNLYRTYDRGFFNRNEMKKRAPGTESAGIGYETDTASYSCDVWAIHHDIDDQVRANADSEISVDRNATNLVSHQALLQKEVNWVSKYFTTSVWTNDRTGVSSGPVAGTSVLQWNDANSTPIEDIADAKRTILESTGFEPNKLVLGRTVYDKLKNHPDIVDRIKYSGGVGNGNPAKVNLVTMAILFEVEEILVMNAIQNTAQEGESNVHSFIGGKHALLTYAAMSPGLEVPTGGYTFSWTGYIGASDMGSRIMRFRMNHLKSDRVELEMAFDQKLVAADLGYFFSGVVA